MGLIETGMDHGLVYGDYYFIKALYLMLRNKHPEPCPKPIEG
jgi:hypothetical protein